MPYNMPPVSIFANPASGILWEKTAGTEPSACKKGFGVAYYKMFVFCGKITSFKEQNRL